MRVSKLKIDKFRGIKSGEIFFPNHGVLVGDNNTGKSTILEAIDLVLGPDRMRRRPVIDEHDFYAGDYLDIENNSHEVFVEVIVTDLSTEQETHFKDHIEWWNNSDRVLLDSPPAEVTDRGDITSALRLSFVGKYDQDEDDFVGDTFFQNPINDNGERSKFRTSDKRKCGFLFLRTLRTGSRALSLERGSLLDIILNLSDIKLKMWEETLTELRSISVADNPELGVLSILQGVQESLQSFVPSDWGTAPQMRVSDLTRENLRKCLNVFMASGAENDNGETHIVPFKRQGTGTVNALVLSMLSMIADLKQNVIFAMEEPEIAIPPHTQKRIINSIREKSSQAMFTSHSPYVLEEFDPSEIIVLQNLDGVVKSYPASFPKTIKRKQYKIEFRKRFCEALLAKRVLIAEGRTEYDALPVAARRLHLLAPEDYSTLEALGIAIIDAETDSQITQVGALLKSLGKITYAVYDKQDDSQGNSISEAIDYPFESPEKSFEKLLVTHVPFNRLKAFALSLVEDSEWPSHLSSCKPGNDKNEEEIKGALYSYFSWSKGAASSASLIESCELDEIPDFIKTTISGIKESLSSQEKTEETVSANENLEKDDHGTF